MTALHLLPAYRQGELIAKGELSSVELVQTYLNRIEQHDKHYRAFISQTPELALQQASDADKAIADGRRLGPLHGLPFALKDAYDTANIRTTAGSKLLSTRVPTTDAYAVSKLKAAGAVLVGKLECTEFCLGGPSLDGVVPHSRNPWDTERYAGGSSSGAGVALAARMVPLTLGSDTGGSIRIPAAFCGVAGHKPTYGLVSLSGLYPLSGSLDHAGPLATCSADCALLLDAISGHNPEDPGSANHQASQTFAALGERLDNLHIGYVVNFSEIDCVSDSMQQSTLNALEALRELGAEVVPVELPDLWDFTTCNSTIMLSEAYALHEQDLQARASEYTAFTRSRISLGSMISAADYINAQKMRRSLNNRLRDTFRNLDILIYPGMLNDPPLTIGIDPFYFLQTPLITAPANVGGIPTASVCSGFSAAGMPQAIQISGRWFEDATVLRVAHAYESVMGFTNRLPPDLEDN